MHVWSAAATPEIEALLELSDYLLVNYREFRELGRHVEGESDETVASRLMARTGGGQGVVVTAEDFTGDGRRLARQNAVHEVGLFQWRHGFDRVMVLVEDGCDFVLRVAEPYPISFRATASAVPSTSSTG